MKLSTKLILVLLIIIALGSLESYLTINTISDLKGLNHQYKLDNEYSERFIKLEVVLPKIHEFVLALSKQEPIQLGEFYLVADYYSAILDELESTKIRESDRKAIDTIRLNLVRLRNDVTNTKKIVSQADFEATIKKNRLEGIFNLIENAQDTLLESIRAKNERTFNKLISSKDELIRNIVIISGVGLFLTAILFIYVVRKIKAPLKQIQSVAEKVAGGDLESQIDYSSGDELGQIALHLNELIASMKKSMKFIKSEEDYVSNVFESMANMLIILDPQSNIKKVNRSTLLALGYMEEDMVGKPIDKFLMRDLQTFKAGALKIMLRDGFINSEEDSLKKKDGDALPVMFSGSVMKDRNGVPTLLICVAQDETAYKQVKLEKEQKTRKLLSLSETSGRIAHDFNNLLGAIQGYTEFLLQDHANDKESVRKLNVIEKSVERAVELSTQLLVSSGHSKDVARDFGINEVIEKVIAAHKSVLPENVKIILKTDPANPVTHGLFSSLEDACSILFMNAIQATKDKGGEIIIETQTFDADETFCKISGLTKIVPGNFIKLCLTDTGSGISEENMKKIFDPFFSTRGGSGLGLPLVQKTVTEHHGNLLITSVENSGTQVTVILPESPPRDTSASQAQRAASPVTMGFVPGVLLVVDDEEAMRKLASEVLGSHFKNVRLAENGAVGLKTYQEHKDEISLIILDVVMPVMDGLALFKGIREINPKASILFCSGYSETGELEGLIKQENVSFLKKPYTKDALLLTLSELLKDKIIPIEVTTAVDASAMATTVAAPGEETSQLLN